MDLRLFTQNTPCPRRWRYLPSCSRFSAKPVKSRRVGYTRRPPKDGRKFCFEPRWEHDFDPAAVEAIRSVIDDLRPSWVSEVKEATKLSNRPRWIADWCELSEQVVVAIILNLRARGELSPQ